MRTIKPTNSLYTDLPQPVGVEPSKTLAILSARTTPSRTTVTTYVQSAHPPTVTETNKSFQDTLNWECTCSSNSSAPGLQYYTQTMPTFICESLFAQCISQTNTQKGSEECKSKIQSKCAEQSPPKNLASDDDDDGDDTSSSATDTATASATQTSSDASGTAAAVTTTASDAFAAPTMAPAGKGAAAAVALGMLAYLV
jgi:hypothetical protein